MIVIKTEFDFETIKKLLVEKGVSFNILSDNH